MINASNIYIAVVAGIFLTSFIVAILSRIAKN